MMHCRNVQSRLSEYLDSFLTPAHREEVEAHLATCEACRGLAREVRLLRDVINDLTAVEPPLSLASRIDRIPREVTQDRSWIAPSTARLSVAVFAAAAAVMLVVLRPAVAGRGVGPSAQLKGDTGSPVVEVHQLMLPEERQGSPDPQWARVAISRGVPLEGPRAPVASAPEQNRDEQIWQEVRRVSACSRRSF